MPLKQIARQKANNDNNKCSFGGDWPMKFFTPQHEATRSKGY